MFGLDFGGEDIEGVSAAGYECYRGSGGRGGESGFSPNSCGSAGDGGDVAFQLACEARGRDEVVGDVDFRQRGGCCHLHYGLHDQGLDNGDDFQNLAAGSGINVFCNTLPILVVIAIPSPTQPCILKAERRLLAFRRLQTRMEKCSHRPGDAAS